MYFICHFRKKIWYFECGKFENSFSTFSFASILMSMVGEFEFVFIRFCSTAIDMRES